MMNLRITGWNALRQYRELAAAVWCCKSDKLEHPDITHESTIKEVERLKRELEEVKYLHQVQMENARIEREEKEEALKEIEELEADIESLRSFHSSPAYNPKTADEALNWISEDRGYGCWSSSDAHRFTDAVELVRDKISKLRKENSDLQKRLSETVDFFEDVKNSVRDKNPKGKTILDFLSVVLFGWEKMTQEKPREMFGTCGWAGTYQCLPAIVLSYYGGAQLWVCDSGQWKSVAKGTCENSVIPHTCEKCGTQLPISNVQ